MNRRRLLQSLSALAVPILPFHQSEDGKKPSLTTTRLKTAICAYSFREALGNKSMTYFDLVRLAADLDMDGLDLTVYWFPSTLDEFLLPLKRLAYKEAVELYSLSIRADLCRPTRDLQVLELEEIKKWVNVAEKLGAGHIRIFGGNVPSGFSEDQATSWVVSILRRAGEYSGTKGVILGLENHGGITEKSDHVIQMVQEANSPWVGINLDTGNFHSMPYEQIESCIPYAVNVQIKVDLVDEQGKPRPADWDRIGGMFAKLNYRGYLALEYEGKETASEAVPSYCRQLKRIARKYSGD